MISLTAKEMYGENLQSASALYVPLLHYPMKTAAKQPTSQRSLTFGKRSLRLQVKSNFGDNWRTLEIAAARMRQSQAIAEVLQKSPRFSSNCGLSTEFCGYSLADRRSVWHTASEMYTPHENDSPELRAILESLDRRRPAFDMLQWRLLRCVRTELKAALESGLTWRMIWQALLSERYTGSYSGFCKAANRSIGRALKPEKRKNLPPPVVEKEVRQQMVRESGLSSESTEKKEKPEWQVRREETMARLDREAELNRQREVRLQPKKVFTPSVFVGRSED
jgi:hypothetical protein